MIDLLGWIGSILGVTGAILNARKMRVGFVFYGVANAALIVVGILKDEWYNVSLFSVFMIIATYGYVVWGRKDP